MPVRVYVCVCVLFSNSVSSVLRESLVTCEPYTTYGVAHCPAHAAQPRLTSNSEKFFSGLSLACCA